mgnify:CR=1 FL=1
MKHLKLFNNESEYQSFTESADYVTPNVCAVKDGQGSVKKDFVFFNPEEEINVNLITFYVVDTSYQCEEGMTWEEFVNSEYNSEGLFQINNYNYIEYNQKIIVLNHVMVFNTDTILNGNIYEFYSSGGGN